MKPLEKLLLDLESPVEIIRVQTLVELVRSGNIKVLPYLRRVGCTDESPQVRYLARKGLKLIRDRALEHEKQLGTGEDDLSAGPDLVGKLVASADADTRLRGFDLAARLGDVSLLPLLREAYAAEQDPVAQASMIRCLAVLGGGRVRALIEQALGCADHRLRANAVEAVSLGQDPTLLPRVMPLLKDGDHRVAANAALALKDYPMADYFSLLAEEHRVEDLSHPDFNVRIEAVKNLVRSAGPARLSALKKTLANERDTYVKATIIKAIGELGGAADVEAVLPFLADSDPRIRANAVETVGILEHSGNLGRLVSFLDDHNNRVRANAVVALKDAYPLKALETLEYMTQDPDVRMKVSAAYACLEVGSDSTVRILGILARDTDMRVSEKAVSSLGLLKDKGLSSAAGVLDALDDSNAADSFVALDDGAIVKLTPLPAGALSFLEDLLADSDVLEIHEILRDIENLNFLNALSLNDDQMTGLLDIHRRREKILNTLTTRLSEQAPEAIGFFSSLRRALLAERALEERLAGEIRHHYGEMITGLLEAVEDFDRLVEQVESVLTDGQKRMAEHYVSCLIPPLRMAEPQRRRANISRFTLARRSAALLQRFRSG